MVYQAEASLFKKNPISFPIITNEIINPTANADLTQIAFLVSSPSANFKAGIYLIETNYLSSILNKYQSKFISPNPYGPNDNNVTLSFSPNSKQLIIKSSSKKISYLLDLSTNTTSQVTEQVIADWDQVASQSATLSLAKIPKVFTTSIATNPASISFSGDDTKFLYLLQDQYHVYDIEKSMDYFIGEQSNMLSPFWLPKSNSIVYTNSGAIKTVEFDGTNDNTIYSGEFTAKVLIPQFDGDKIIISIASKAATFESLQSLTIR